MGHQAALAPLDHRAEIRHCEATCWSLAATHINSRQTAQTATPANAKGMPAETVNACETFDARFGSAAAEDWRALFHEGARRLAMIFRQPGLDLVPCFEIEEFAQRAALRGIEIPLHQFESDARALPQFQCECVRRVDEFAVVHDLIGYAQSLRLGRIERSRGVIKFARFAGADELRQKIAAAEVTGESHFGEGGHETRRSRRDTKIAGAARRLRNSARPSLRPCSSRRRRSRRPAPRR